jgi:hypothetical protein
VTKFGPWEVACDLADGARIGALRYDGIDLLTTAPAQFRPPAKDYGRYETRPVYGYDDCFPTVDGCDGWPDHGELCWRAWQGSAQECAVRSARWPVTFTRRLAFAAGSLTWNFAVRNDGDRPRAFQHVMHPLMPLDQITGLELPGGADSLLAVQRGQHTMRFVPGGHFALIFRGGLRLNVRFDTTLFPTLGIWWNNRGYPDEDGLRRCECAFEPTPGKNSTLTDGTTLVAPPQGTVSWQVVWELTRSR